MKTKTVTKYYCQFCDKEFGNEADAKEHEKGHLSQPITLQEAIEKMENAICNIDLSDDYLLDHEETTRPEIFGGDYVYGIAVVPASFALILAKRLLQETKDETELIPYK